MSAQAEYVRTVRRWETLKDLVEEAKALAWVAEAEHAVVQLVTGERILVQGGPTGIQFLLGGDGREVFVILKGNPVRVKRLYFHTHPRVTGPSADDLEFLKLLGQTRSYLFEIGGDLRGTLIRPKEGERDED